MQLSLFEPEGRSGLPAKIGPARVVESHSLSLLTPGKGRTSDYAYTLNPYRGCSFACTYCFAQAFVADDALRADWGKWVEAKTRAVEILKKKDLRGRNLFMSSVTDPYQPLERKIELTRSIVEELVRQQARLVVQTRSPIAQRDIDLFLKLAHVRVNVSITTDDETVRRRFEPNCASIDQRLETIIRMKEAGIRTCICISPMLPMRDPEAFAKRISSIGPTSVTTAYFLVNEKAFASDTRKLGLEIAEEFGWTRHAYEKALTAMMRHLPELTRFGEAFAPEGKEKSHAMGTEGREPVLY